MGSESLADEQLMAEVATGRAERLELLVRRYATPLLSFLHRLVGDRHRAEDLFQDVFLAVWTNRRLYQPPRPFRPWLYTIALNRCRAHLRSRREPAVGLDADALAGATTPAEGLATRQETARQVFLAVQGLPTQQRIVVTLRVWDELPYAQIAEVMNLSEATVRSHMHHALAALRRELGEANTVS